MVVAGSVRSYLRNEPGRARRLGYVPEDGLPALYGNAAALAMPSLYEGFGLPCVEAMACGTPVVASDAAALPEACGGAALLADPTDPAAFAEALLAAVGTERERLRSAGLERARQLTWERTAELADAAVGELLASIGRRLVPEDERRAPRPACRSSPSWVTVSRLLVTLTCP